MDSVITTLAAYAKHRGVSAMAVSRAVKAGRLVESVVRDEHNVPKIKDVALADREWMANSNYTDAPHHLAQIPPELRSAFPELVPAAQASVDGADSMMEAQRRAAWAKAQLAELKLKEATGEVVPADRFVRKLNDVFLAVRTKLLALPSRARIALPELSPTQLGTLETLVREALEELAEEGTP